MKRKSIFLAITAMMILLLSACNGSSSKNSPEPADGTADDSDADKYLLEQAEGFTSYTVEINKTKYQLGDKAKALRDAGWHEKKSTINPGVNFTDAVGDGNTAPGFQTMGLQHPDFKDVTLMADIDVRALSSKDKMEDGYITSLHMFIDNPETTIQWKIGGVIDQNWTVKKVQSEFPLAQREDKDTTTSIDLYPYCHYKNIESAYIDYENNTVVSISITFDTTSLVPDTSPTTTATPSADMSGTMAGAFLSEYANSSTMLTRMIFHSEKEGVFSGEVTIASRLNESVYQMEYEGQKVRFLMLNDAKYMVSDNEKTAINLAIAGIDSSYFTIPQYLGYSVIGSGTDTVLDKTLPYEEVSLGESGSVRYYFEGTRLAYVEGESGDDKFVMEILEYTTKVPEELFKIPSDYFVADSIQDMINTFS